MELGLLDSPLLVGVVAVSGALRNERRTFCGTFFLPPGGERTGDAILQGKFSSKFHDE
jgi:hypothetical protein